MNLLDKKVLVGVTGGIAAYKTCSLVTTLLSRGAIVKVMMTEGAKKFVSPLTFQSLTNFPVYDDLWESKDENSVEHITVSHWADIIVIAPATANTIAKIAYGLADNFLTTAIMASIPDVKIILAPAMNNNMWSNPIVQNNIKILKDLKRYIMVEPRSGVLACRDEGKGKIADTEAIMGTISKIIGHE